MDKRWIEGISLLLNSWKAGVDDPLDGDAVDDMLEVLKVDINLFEGNITQKEADEYFDNRV